MGPAAGLWREAVGLLPDLGRLLRALVRDPRVPAARQGLAGVAAAAYVASPIDLLPDIVPGVGGIDDLLVGALARCGGWSPPPATTWSASCGPAPTTGSRC